MAALEDQGSKWDRHMGHEDIQWMQERWGRRGAVPSEPPTFPRGQTMSDANVLIPCVAVSLQDLYGYVARSTFPILAMFDVVKWKTTFFVFRRIRRWNKSIVVVGPEVDAEEFELSGRLTYGAILVAPIWSIALP